MCQKIFLIRWIYSIDSTFARVKNRKQKRYFFGVDGKKDENDTPTAQTVSLLTLPTDFLAKL